MGSEQQRAQRPAAGERDPTPATPLHSPHGASVVPSADARLQAADLLALQRTVGNAAVRRMLPPHAAVTVSRDGPDGATATAVPSYAVTIQLPTRDPLALTIRTLEDLYNAYDRLDGELFFARSDVMPDRRDNPHWDEYETAEEDVRANGQAYAAYRDRFSEPVDAEEVRDFRNLVVRVTNIATRANRRFVTDMRRQLNAANRAAESADRQARNAIRDAFLMESAEANETAAHLWALTDQLQQFTFGIAEQLADEATMLRSVSGLVPRAVAIANVVKDWQRAQPQAFGTPLESMTDLRNVWSLSSAGISIAGSPLGIFTSHIGPMLETIDNLMGRLQRSMREFNDTLSDYGMDINPMVEPGGADMWNFMVRLMRARSASQVRAPTGEALRYFDHWRERFDQSNRARGRRTDQNVRAMPTRSSWIVFTEADPDALGAWAFDNREFLWVTLYGARNAATAREWTPARR